MELLALKEAIFTILWKSTEKTRFDFILVKNPTLMTWEMLYIFSFIAQ